MIHLLRQNLPKLTNLQRDSLWDLGPFAVGMEDSPTCSEATYSPSSTPLKAVKRPPPTGVGVCAVWGLGVMACVI